MNWLAVGAACLASTTLYVGLYHLLFYFRTRERRELLPFSLTCFAIVAYDVFCACLYSAETVEVGMFWQRWQFVSLAVMSIALLWFVKEFVREKPTWLDAVFVALFGGIGLFASFDKSNLAVSSEPFVKTFDFLELFPVTFNEVKPGPVLNLMSFVGLCMGVYLMFLLVRYCRKSECHEARPIIIGMVILLAGVLSDTAVTTGLYNCIYLTEYSYLFLTAGVAMSLTLRYVATTTALKWSKEELLRLAAAVHAAAESIVITDEKHVIQYVNPAFERMTGYSSGEVVGKTPALLKSGKHDAGFYDRLHQTIVRGESWQGRFINKRKDGSLFHEDAVISAVRDVSGKVVNYVAVKRDVTLELALKGQILQSQKMAALGQLAGRVVHDFTNVLAVITGNAQIAKQKITPPSDLIPLIEEILAATHRIAPLTAQLMSFAHPAPLSTKILDLSRAISGVEMLLAGTIGPSINLKIERNRAGKVNADPYRIEQAVVHMAINAMEAMPNGGDLRVVTRPAELTPTEIEQMQVGIPDEIRHNGQFAELFVADNGRGIPEEMKPRIFEPYFTTKEDKRNSGLGLAIVYSIVKQHNGYIVVESQPGQGTTIRVILPAIEE